MNNSEAIKWLKNLKDDIGNPSYISLWHYEQALVEIIHMLEYQEYIKVVLCKYCKHWNDDDCDIGNNPRMYNEDWFCPAGEVKHSD